MMKFKIISFGIIVFLLCSSLVVYTQKINVDSLINITNTAPDDTNKVIAFRAVCGIMANTNPKQSVEFGWRGVALARKIKWDKGIAGCYLNLGNVYGILGKYDSAVLILDTALIYSKRVGEDKRTALVYINSASAFINLGKLDLAMQQALSAMPYAESSGDLDRKARVNMTIGNIYFFQENWESANKYYKRCIPMFETLGLQNMAGTALMNVAIVYKHLNKLDSAENIIKKSILIFTENEDKENLTLGHNNYGGILVLKNDLAAAEKEYLAAVELAVSIGDLEQQIFNKQALGDIYFKRKQFKQASDLLMPIMDSAIVYEFYDEQLNIASTLSDLFAEQQNYGEAYKYLKLYNIAKDTINERKQNDKLLTLQEQFTSKEKEKEISLLNATNALQQKEIERKNLLGIVFGLVFILLLALGMVFWNRYRLKQQIKEINLRNKIASDLHDDVGATLSSIKMYSEIIKNDIPDTGKNTTALLTKIIENTTESIENMSDIVWMVKPGNDKLQNLSQRLIDYAANMCNSANIQLITNLQLNENVQALPMELRRDIYLVLKEAVNNAVKYSKGTILDLSLNISEKHLQANVADNGVGFDSGNIKNGNGLANMQNRITKHKGNFNINSSPQEGTKVTFDVPV